MTVRNLEFLFAPGSVALIGASERAGSVGATVLRNLREAQFAGTIYAVNPKHREISGLRAFASVRDVPARPDLAVICTPPQSVPQVIAQCGETGTRAAIVLTAGLGAKDASGRTLRTAMLEAAKPHLLRVLGPNCVGLIVPSMKLNASFAHTNALPGRVAFVSQSGALVTAVLDWAKTRGIGFSKFVSLGESADVDFGDVIDYLASDSETQAILLYIEAIVDARKFMSAARAAARNKPVLVVKAGRAPEGAKAATSHTGALAGSDAVYDAAIRRAGMLRVFTTEDLFDTVETLARARPVAGDRLAILTNGGGPAVMAADELSLSGGKLATLGADTLARLDAVLPATWSRGNPVDIIGDAPVQRYVDALEILLEERSADAILLIHAPTAVVPSADIASALAPIITRSGHNVIGCWLGGDAVAQARRTFASAGIPAHDTPENAVHAVMQIVRYRRNQDLLSEMPSSAGEGTPPDRAAAGKVVHDVLHDGRAWLSEAEAKVVLAAYGIPVVATRIAADIDAARELALAIGFPVALKILSRDITHKSDVGGVALNLSSADAVSNAASTMLASVQRARPDARIEGFTVQAMVQRHDAYELIAGIALDAVFGPVILFGQGGTAVEVLADRAIGLPPLNTVLSRELVSRTRIAKMLAGYRNRPPADLDAICSTLVQLSQLAIDIPEIAELDINPLLADERGVIALDARVRVASSGKPGLARLCIRPYPQELEEHASWNGERILLRPIRPEDAARHRAFFDALDPEDVRRRALTALRELAPSQLARLTQIDYDREMAFIALRGTGRDAQTIGVIRSLTDPDNECANFTMIVRSDLKGRGLGSVLLAKMIAYTRSRGTRELAAEALSETPWFMALAQRFGFRVSPAPDAARVRVALTVA